MKPQDLHLYLLPIFLAKGDLTILSLLQDGQLKTTVPFLFVTETLVVEHFMFCEDWKEFIKVFNNSN